MDHPTDKIAHAMTFVTPVVKYWLELKIAQWVHHEGSIRHIYICLCVCVCVCVCVTFVPKFMLYNHQINHNGSLTDNIFKTNN